MREERKEKWKMTALRENNAGMERKRLWDGKVLNLLVQIFMEILKEHLEKVWKNLHLVAKMLQPQMQIRKWLLQLSLLVNIVCGHAEMYTSTDRSFNNYWGKFLTGFCPISIPNLQVISVQTPVCEKDTNTWQTSGGTLWEWWACCFFIAQRSSLERFLWRKC